MQQTDQDASTILRAIFICVYSRCFKIERPPSSHFYCKKSQKMAGGQKQNGKMVESAKSIMIFLVGKHSENIKFSVIFLRTGIFDSIQ